MPIGRPEIIIEVDGVDRVADRVDQVSRRIWDHEPAYERILTKLERVHRRSFQLRGYKASGLPHYVLTGRLRSSLIRQGPDSHRRVFGQGLTFGTRVPYAQFHFKRDRHRELGQIPFRSGRSAVVLFPRSVKREVAREIKKFIAEPWGAR